MTIDERIAYAEANLRYAENCAREERVREGSFSEESFICASYWAGYIAGLKGAKLDIVSAEGKRNGK